MKTGISLLCGFALGGLVGWWVTHEKLQNEIAEAVHQRIEISDENSMVKGENFQLSEDLLNLKARVKADDHYDLSALDRCIDTSNYQWEAITKTLSGDTLTSVDEGSFAPFLQEWTRSKNEVFEARQLDLVDEFKKQNAACLQGAKRTIN